eukprot:COSAG01_NODE_2014_length_8644_cov_70.285079_6_plen_902_part_00
MGSAAARCCWWIAGAVALVVYHPCLAAASAGAMLPIVWGGDGQQRLHNIPLRARRVARRSVGGEAATHDDDDDDDDDTGESDDGGDPEDSPRHRFLQAGRKASSVISATARASEAIGYAYFATITVGSKAGASELGVHMDTGSFSLAIPAKFCTNCAAGIATYDPRQSTTAVPMRCTDSRCNSQALFQVREQLGSAAECVTKSTLKCTTNSYDIYHGKGQCAKILAAGHITCENELSATGKYKHYCDEACGFVCQKGSCCSVQQDSKWPFGLCLQRDHYADGGGSMGPIYQDDIRLGGRAAGHGVAHNTLSTRGYFKAFTVDTGGAYRGNHFQQAHAVGAGIWGLGMPSGTTDPFVTGVYDMGSVLTNLLRDNHLSDSFGLCFDSSHAVFSDAAGPAASSLDLGGADPTRFIGPMRRLKFVSGAAQVPLANGTLVPDASKYYIAGPAQILVGSHDQPSAPVNQQHTVNIVRGVATHDSCRDTDATCQDAAKMGGCDVHFIKHDKVRKACPMTCGTCHVQHARMDSMLVDSGNSNTFGVTADVWAALSTAILAWFGCTPATCQTDLSGVSSRKPACNEQDRWTEQALVLDGGSCSNFMKSPGCSDMHVRKLCPVTCGQCIDHAEAGAPCNPERMCGRGLFCNPGNSAVSGVCAPCALCKWQGVPPSEPKPACAEMCSYGGHPRSSAAAEVAFALFGTPKMPPDSVKKPRPACLNNAIGNAAAHHRYLADIDFLNEFPNITLRFPGASPDPSQPLDITFRPDDYLHINNGVAICRFISIYKPTGSGVLGAGFLRRYYALFDRPNRELGLAPHGSCTPETPPAQSTVEMRCLARSAGGCSSCAGPIDDMEKDSGYCIWCPKTKTCTAYDPDQLVPPCPGAQGWATASLDTPPVRRTVISTAHSQ